MDGLRGGLYAERLAGVSRVAPSALRELRYPLRGIQGGLWALSRRFDQALLGLAEWGPLVSQVQKLDHVLGGYERLVAPSGSAVRFGVGEVVELTVALLASRLRRLGGRFSFIAEATPCRAWGSPDVTLHALSHLLLDAIDAAGKAGAGGRVKVRMLSTQDAVQVRVSTWGLAPPESLWQRIWRRLSFRRRPRAPLRGLRTAQALLRPLGGEVRLAGEDDPARLEWAETERVLELPARPIDPRKLPGAVARTTALSLLASVRALAALAAAGGAAAGLLALSTGEAGARPAPTAPLVPVGPALVSEVHPESHPGAHAGIAFSMSRGAPVELPGRQPQVQTQSPGKSAPSAQAAAPVSAPVSALASELSASSPRAHAGGANVDLMLALAALSASARRSGCEHLAGAVDQGAQVLANGAPLSAEAGRIDTALPLRSGRTLRLTLRDGTGREQSRLIRCREPSSKEPPIEVRWRPEVRWGSTALARGGG